MDKAKNTLVECLLLEVGYFTSLPIIIMGQIHMLILSQLPYIAKFHRT